MNKQEFLAQLGKGLSGLPKDDIDERLTFYREQILARLLFQNLLWRFDQVHSKTVQT